MLEPPPEEILTARADHVCRLGLFPGPVAICPAGRRTSQSGRGSIRPIRQPRIVQAVATDERAQAYPSGLRATRHRCQ
jgi:hypothetical protein